jgi:hypothetical protein
MLSYRGIGDIERAKQHEVRYLRFKADEASQALTGAYRNLHPHDNNERQAIHEHVSVDLTPSKAAQKIATMKAPPKRDTQAKATTTNNPGSTD